MITIVHLKLTLLKIECCCLDIRSVR